MTSFVSPPLLPTDSAGGVDGLPSSVGPRLVSEPLRAWSPRERRLQAEWELLLALIELNPDRLGEAYRRDTEIAVTLSATPSWEAETGRKMLAHRLLLVFPLFYPSMPMEAYLLMPARHPNVHPETGFVCLWDRHRVSNTVEHAVHKTALMLGWRLLNRESVHCMQPGALRLAEDEVWLERAQRELWAEPLVGVTGYNGPTVGAVVSEGELTPRRRRLS